MRNAHANAEPCPICGGMLRDEIGSCGACPMNSGCAMLCCENCGYSTVAAQSATVNFFKRLFGRRHHKDRRASGISGATPGRDPRTGLV